MSQMEEVARDIHRSADRLDSFARTGQVSSYTHKDHLMQIKSLVNEDLQPALSRLTEIRPDLPEWQQDAVDQILDSAKGLAVNTNSAILSMNEAAGAPVLLNAEYGEFVSLISDHAEALVKTADAAGTYADAHLRAVEAGLKVAQY